MGEVLGRISVGESYTISTFAGKQTYGKDIIRFGRITSDVITGMGVTQSVRVGKIASESVKGWAL